ncbi:MAG: hypothetical protein PHN88_14400 [Ignavibacteria bacterium]|nr:hypothetical protein [Ignavibacteria bacterium]
MKIPIKNYALAWQPGINRGSISVILQNNNKINLPVETPEELAALAAILRNKSACFDDESKFIHTDWIMPE